MSNFIVCPRCAGTGVHDPEAFSNGFTQEELDEDLDFQESYFSGHYDVFCTECNGLRVINPDAELKLHIRQLIKDENTCSACDRQAILSCGDSYQEYSGGKTWTDYTYYCAEHADSDWIKEHQELLSSLGVL